MKSISYILLSLTFSLQTAAQNRHYVNQSATGANTGQTWADAHTDLQTALSAAQPGDEIWVAEGTYRPTDSADRLASFVLKSGVRLYGGFAGSETELAQRDWAAHPTVLSGDIGALGDSTDNSFNILYLENPDVNTLVDGLTFQNGQADNLNTVNFGDRGNSGAALYIMAYDDEAYPDVRNCVFERNYAYGSGGAVYVNGAGGGSVAPRFLHCTFRHNRARRDGGAVYRDGGSWEERAPDFGYCRFEGNQAMRNGGGLWFRDSEGVDTLQIVGCVFSANRASNNGGAFDIWAGRSDGSRFVIDSCLIEKNWAENSSAARMWPKGSFQPAIYARIANSQWVENGDSLSNRIIDFVLFPPDGDGGLMIVESCLFKGNTGVGTLFLVSEFDTTILRKSIFIENHLRGNASALLLHINKYRRVVENCLFLRNETFNNLTFQFMYIFPFQEISNNIFANNKNLDYTYFLRNSNIDPFVKQVKHCIFINNRSQYRFALSSAKIQYQNCAFYGEAAPALLFGSYSAVSLRHCYFDSLDCAALPNVTCDGGMVVGGDPGFRDTSAGDYHLLPCSPLRDAGLNIGLDTIPFDFDGNPRILGGTADIGAYEAPAFAFAAAPQVKAACNGAANGAISVLPADGCEPLSYLWQPGGLAGPVLGGLSPGTYQITVTDAQGRIASDTITVPAAPSPTLQVDGQPISCFGADDAMLSVTPLTGQPPFAYLWSPSGVTDSVATGLGPGPASVTVTDAWGCTASFSFDIPEPDTLQFAATVQDASGSQSADGSILVNNVTGGTAPYSYLWEPGGSMESMLNNLNPGLYALTVTDERGCEAAWTFEVKAIVGTGEAGGQALLLIYPNPAGESATVAGDFGEKMPTVLELYDAAGKLSGTLALAFGGGGGQVWELPLEGLSAGAYAVLLRGADGKVVGAGRLVKM